MTQTTTHPPVPMPVGAVKTEDWQPNGDGRFYRFCEGETREVVAGTRYGEHAVAVYAHAMQFDDGSIDDGTDPAFEPPSISLLTVGDDGRQTDTGITVTGDAARRLADVLVTPADEVDGWSAR